MRDIAFTLRFVDTATHDGLCDGEGCCGEEVRVLDVRRSSRIGEARGCGSEADR